MGAAVPGYRDGRYSRYLPKGLRDRAAEMLDDPDLLSLRAEIALLDALLAGMVPNLTDGMPASPRMLDMIEQRRKLAEAERNRLEALQATITVAEAYRMVDAVVATVAEHVRDAGTLTAISRDLERILGGQRPAGPPVV